MVISITELPARVAAVTLLIALGWTERVEAVVPLDEGIPQLRTVTTNLDGGGLAVAQIEASTTDDGLTWEVNPANALLTNTLFNYTTYGGTTNVYANALGFESSHADAVGGIFYGLTNGVAPGVARVDDFDADFFFYDDICNPNSPAISDPVVNQSFTFGPLSAADQGAVDSLFDNYAAQNQTLFISAANNYGNSPVVCAPGTAYNSIGVGAYANGTFANSIGPTLDNGRCKPDISAAGAETSYSTPMVAGAAAVLMQAGLRGDGGAATIAAADLRTIKALLLNGAVKTPDWTNGPASPLDARYGAGILNLLNAYKQLAGGEHHFVSAAGVPLGGPHPPATGTGGLPEGSGWDFNTITSAAGSDTINHYTFQPCQGAGQGPVTLTATLVWNRQLNQTNINNLSLFLYNGANSNLVTASTSLVDNVQHLWVRQLPPGRYDLQVRKAGGVPGTNCVSAAETYSLAWAWVSPPLSMAFNGTNAVLQWPLYPAGFTLQSTTNLLLPVWSTNCLAGLNFTNGINCLTIRPSCAARFFQLSPP